MNKQKVTVAIEPYFDAEVENLGLEKYGLAVHDGSEYQEYLSVDNTGRFVTGLDPQALYIRYITDEDKKAALLEQINANITRLEKTFGEGSLDAKNTAFWSTLSLDIKHSGRTLDLLNPRDELLYHALKAGSFSEVAKSYEEAINSSNKTYKFYLKEAEEEASIKTERSVEIGRCQGILVDLLDKDSKKLFFLGKILLPSNKLYTEDTPKSIIYTDLVEYVEGKSVKIGKKSTPREFLATSKLSKEDLTLMAYIKDAIYFMYISQNANDQYYYNIDTQTRLGKNPKEIVEFLKSPHNRAELDVIESKVLAKWKQ